MFKFLAKGLLRDRSRSLFPILIIAAGVMITVVVYSWLNGFSAMLIKENARFETGHVKIITSAYKELMDQRPYDLGLTDVDQLLTTLESRYSTIKWKPRIYFGGLLDLPDEEGTTIEQGEVMGLAVDLFNDQYESDLLNLHNALTAGELPQQHGELLISEEIAEKMNIPLGAEISLIGSTMYGSMAITNFRVTGFLRFGIQAMDRGAVIADIADIRYMLDMDDAASEVLGFLPTYNEDEIVRISEDFNAFFHDDSDEFSPLMITLRSQQNLDYLLSAMQERMGLFIFIFVFVMSLVLWNSGLMNGIRRYGEIGVRLAIGENKHHIYGSLLVESIVTGIIATIIGTICGLIISYILQYNGINIASLMKDVQIVMGSKMQAQVTATSYYIGFIPGVMASLIGAAISGLGIYRRKTAQLFKELEA